MKTFRKLFLVMVWSELEAFHVRFAFSHNPFNDWKTETSKGCIISVEFGYSATKMIPLDAQNSTVSGDSWDL